MGDVSMKCTPLNPCVKCGYNRVMRSDRVDLGDYGFLIKCPRCQARSKIGFTKSDADSAWNAQNPKAESEEIA